MYLCSQYTLQPTTNVHHMQMFDCSINGAFISLSRNSLREVTGVDSRRVNYSFVDCGVLYIIMLSHLLLVV